MPSCCDCAYCKRSKMTVVFAKLAGHVDTPGSAVLPHERSRLHGQTGHPGAVPQVGPKAIAASLAFLWAAILCAAVLCMSLLLCVSQQLVGMFTAVQCAERGVAMQLLGPDADGARFFQSAGKVTERPSCTAGGRLRGQLQAGLACSCHRGVVWKLKPCRHTVYGAILFMHAMGSACAVEEVDLLRRTCFNSGVRAVTECLWVSTFSAF